MADDKLIDKLPEIKGDSTKPVEAQPVDVEVMDEPKDNIIPEDTPSPVLPKEEIVYPDPEDITISKEPVRDEELWEKAEEKASEIYKTIIPLEIGEDDIAKLKEQENLEKVLQAEDPKYYEWYKKQKALEDKAEKEQASSLENLRQQLIEEIYQADKKQRDLQEFEEKVQNERYDDMSTGGLVVRAGAGLSLGALDVIYDFIKTGITDPVSFRVPDSKGLIGGLAAPALDFMEKATHFLDTRGLMEDYDPDGPRWGDDVREWAEEASDKDEKIWGLRHINAVLEGLDGYNKAVRDWVPLLKMADAAFHGIDENKQDAVREFMAEHFGGTSLETTVNEIADGLDDNIKDMFAWAQAATSIPASPGFEEVFAKGEPIKFGLLNPFESEESLRWWLANVPQGFGSSVGFIANMRMMGGALKNMNISQNTKAALIAVGATNSESVMIGDQVFKHSLLTMVPEYNETVGEQVDAIKANYEEYLREYENKELASFHMMHDVNQVIEEGLRQLPDETKQKIITDAQKAREFAIKFNNATAVFNFTMSKLVLGGKGGMQSNATKRFFANLKDALSKSTTSTARTEAFVGLSKTAWAVVREMGQEAIEEGPMNTGAELSGNQYGKYLMWDNPDPYLRNKFSTIELESKRLENRPFSITDGEAMVHGSQMQNSALLGSITSGIQTTGTQFSNEYLFHRSSRAAQSKAITELQKIVRNIGDPELLNKYTALNSQYRNLAIVQEEIDHLNSVGAYEKAAELSKNLLSEQARFALQWNAMDNLVRYYNKIASTKSLSPEMRRNAAEAVEKLEQYEKMWNDTDGKANRNEIYLNRVNDDIYRKQIAEIEAFVQELQQIENKTEGQQVLLENNQEALADLKELRNENSKKWVTMNSNSYQQQLKRKDNVTTEVQEYLTENDSYRKSEDEFMKDVQEILKRADISYISKYILEDIKDSFAGTYNRQHTILTARDAAEQARRGEEVDPDITNLTPEEYAIKKQKEEILETVEDSGKKLEVNNEERLLSPPEKRTKGRSEKSKLKQGTEKFYNAFVEKFKKQPTFKELIQDAINTYGVQKIKGTSMKDSVFGYLYKGWHFNGYTPIAKKKAKKMYDAMFTAQEEGMAIFDTLGTDETSTAEEQSTEEKNEEENKEGKKSKAIKDLEALTKKAVKGLSFFVYKFVRSEKVNDYDEAKLIGDKFLGTTFLDSKKLKPGTKLEIRVPKNAEEMKITYVDENGKRVPMTFGQLVKDKKLKRTDAEYAMYVPMIIYLGSDPVAYVNSPTYFTSALAEKEVFKGAEGNGKRYAIEKAQENSTLLREKVFADGKAEIEITKRKYKISKFRTNAVRRTLEKRNVNALIGYTDQDGYIRTNEGIFNVDDVVIISKEDIKKNHKVAYHFVEYTIENGKEKPVYFAEKLTYKDPLNSQRELNDVTSVSSITWALIAYVSQFDTTGILAEELGKIMTDNKGNKLGKENFSKKAMDNIASEIRRISKNKDFSGFDIKQVDSLKDYIRSFAITNISAGTIKEVFNNVMADRSLPEGTPYIGIAGISVVIGVKGERKPDGSLAPPVWINPGTEKEPMDRKVAQTIAKVIKDASTRPATEEIWKKTMKTKVGAFYKFKINISEKVNELKYFPILDSSGKIMKTTYQQFLQRRLWSTMSTIDIGTKENPNHVINVEPEIDFRLVTKEKKTSSIEETPEEKKVKKKKEKKKKEKKKKKDKEDKRSTASQVIEDAIDDLELWGIVVQKDNGGKIEGLMNPPDLNDEDTKQKLRDAHSDKTGLLSYQKDALINELRGLIIDEIEPGKKTRRESINNKIKKKLDTWIAGKQKITDAKKAALNKLKEEDLTPAEKQFFDAVFDAYAVLDAQINSVINNFEQLRDDAWEIAKKDIDIKTGKFTEEELEDEAGAEEDTRTDEEEIQDNRDTNYTKTSIEENNKAKTPYKLRRFLEGFFKFDRNGDPIITFLGIQDRYSADYIYDKIEEILSHGNDVASSFEDMMDKLLDQAEKEPWIGGPEGFVAKISSPDTDSDIRMGFVYHFAMHSLRMKVAVYTKNKSGGYSLQVQDSNANEMAKVVVNDWKTKLEMGALTDTDGDLYSVDRETANLLIEEYKELQKIEDKEDAKFLEQARKWLETFGIEMTDEGWQEFITDGYQYGSKKIPFEDHFGKHTSGIFRSLHDTLAKIVAEEGSLTYEDNENNDIYFKTQEIKALARIEAKHSNLPSSKNFRDGDKSVYGYTAPKFATDRAAELRKNESVLVKLLSMPFSKNSMWLKMLQQSALFRDTFDVEHIGPTALREHSKSLKGVDMGVTKLADADIELAKLAMFTHNNDKIEKVFNKIGDVSIRVARMFFPTMSDKSQMLTVNTIALDLKSNDMAKKDEGHPSYIEIMYEQVVENELQRIINFHQNKAKMNKLPDGYALGAQIFHFIPELNNVTDGNGTRIIQLIAENRFNDTARTIFETKAKNVLAQVVVKEKIKKINEWYKFDFISNDKDGNTDLKAMPVDYMRKFTGSDHERVSDFAEEYVVNSLISNANIFMSIAGDIAMFSVDKAFGRGRFNEDADGIPIPYSPVNNSIYSKISESIIGVNLGKRLALLLAPGLKIANSKNDKYTQIFLQDSIDISPDIVEITRIFYGQSEATKVQKALEGKTKEEQRQIADELADKYSDIAAYFKIESTDGQEYSTMGEHIDIIYRQGRMKQELRDSIIKKYKQQTTVLKNDDVITKEMEFTNEELKVILQPIKPVYTGQIMDESLNTARTMYIKTSSFPLIPQLTRGTKLDKLRIMMEGYENHSGMKVRATFFTGSKVGGMNVNDRLPIEAIEELDVTDFDDFGTSIAATSLVLDRKYFRIQQDVPYKSAKREEDVVALGTQMLKLLFGDGILNINDGFFYKGQEIQPDRDDKGNITVTAGQKLYNRYAEAFGNLVVQKKKMLYHELGVNEFGETENLERSIKNLQRILKEEAIEKGYPEQDVKALTLVADVILTGKDGTLGAYKLSTEDIELINEASDIGIIKGQEEQSEEEKKKIANYEENIRPKLERMLREDIVDEIEAGDVKTAINDMDFSIPLWLSPNSNRYESILNGIVNKRLVKLKIPGNGFVVGSEIGFALENLDAMINDTEAVDDAKLTDSIDTLEDLENVAVGKINSRKGDDKYFLLRSQVSRAMIRRNLNRDSKGGARRKGKYYYEIKIHGDYYSHKTIMDWKGNDKVDIVIIDDIKDIEAQYDAYVEGGAKQFTGFEINEDNLKLAQKEAEEFEAKDKSRPGFTPVKPGYTGKREFIKSKEGLQERMTKRLPQVISPTARKHTAKELVKTRQATQFIGEGSRGSSTDRYMKMYEEEGVANTGNYTANDVIYVSSNGARGGRVNPVSNGVLQGEYVNIAKAMRAGATIVMDTKAHLDRTKRYNIGELALAEYLENNGYERQGETGVWKPAADTEVSFDAGLGTSMIPITPESEELPLEEADMEGFTPKEEHHITLLGFSTRAKINEILSKKSDTFTENARQQIEELIAKTEISYRETNEFYKVKRDYKETSYIKDGETIVNPAHTRETIIQIVDIQNWDAFYEELSKILGEKIEPQLPHITRMVKGHPMGIGINSQEQFDELETELLDTVEKEEDETLEKVDTVEGIQQDQIIWTSKHNGKELQGTLSREGDKVNYAQVLVPSKFRMKDATTGKMVLVDLFQDFDGTDGLYVEKIGGRIMLKEDMFDPDLLGITSFRIPTSSHVSLSQVEIVGFLPPNSGDLMIVPKGFITKKGLDFDVDKEFTYQMWGHQENDGSFTALDAAFNVEMLETVMAKIDEHVDAYQEMIKTEYKPWLRGDKKTPSPRNAFIHELAVNLGILRTGRGKDVAAENVQIEQDLFNMLKDPKKYNAIYEKVVVNDIIRIHQSVLGNPNEEVQKKVNKVLSTNVAEKQAEVLTDLSKPSTAEGNKYFTMLSDMYQKEKMNLGSAGRVGIGVYSNYVVMHSLLQQSGTEHRLSPEKDSKLPSSFDIGGLKSTGVLAREDALQGNAKAKRRAISEVLAEAQNTATDNEKLQTMGRTNINEHTINVHSIMILLGFDLNYATDNKLEINVPYFFLSQPIIKKYVEIMNMHKSILSEDKTQYMSPLELKAKVIKDLIAKYKKIGSESADSKLLKKESSMTADALVDNIKGRDEDVNPYMQIKVIEAFEQLDAYAADISNTQQRMTVSTKGLGKSLFEAADKYNNVMELASPSLITGTPKLVGDYIDTPDSDTKIKELMDKGYVQYGYMMVKPTTPVGSILVHSAKASNDLWNRFFPYNHPDVQYVLDEGLRIFGKQKASTKQKTEAKHTIMKELKKYLFTNSSLGLFGGMASDTRKDLFFDDGVKHQSLANYLDKLGAKMISENYDPNIRKVIINNPLLARFTYSVKKNGMPSLIKFNNAAGENLNENYLYNSLVELMLQDFDLPPYNGQPYNTKKLAQDLIAYAYLEGGVQEAVQFVKYVSVDYLNITAFGEKARSWGEMGKTYISDAMQVSLRRLLDDYVRIEEGDIMAIAKTPEELKDMESLIQDINNEHGRGFVAYNPTNQTITFGNQEFGDVLKTARRFQHEVSRFGMQLAQHNPELLRKVEVDMKTGLVTDQNVTNMDSKKVTEMQRFNYDVVIDTVNGPMVDEDNRPPFLAVYNKNIRKGQSKYHVFYYNGTQYVRIPTLGIFGMNEYDQKKPYQKSEVNKSDLKYSPTAKPSKETKPQAVKVKFDVGGKVTSTLEKIANNNFKTDTGRVAAIVAQQLLDSPGLNTDLKVEVKAIRELPDGRKPNGEYIPLSKTNNEDRGKAIINSETIENRSEDKFAATFIEEVLHSVTVETVDQYIESYKGETGKWEYRAKSGAPDFAIRMVRLFNKTRSVLGITDEELSQNTSELLDSKGDTSETGHDRRLEVYRMSNIHEFIAGIFTDVNFRKKLGNITYKDTNISIIDRFKDIVMNIFTAIGIPFKRNSIGAQAMDATLNWLADDTKSDKEEEALKPDDEPSGLMSPPDNRSVNEKLESTIIEFLDKLNVDVHFDGKYILANHMKYAPDKDLVGAADILNKLISVTETREYNTLPKMASYMIMSLLGQNNDLYKRMSQGIKRMPGYGERYAYWKSVYDPQQRRQKRFNRTAHEQVLAEFIAEGMINNFGQKISPKQKRKSEDRDKDFYIKRGLSKDWGATGFKKQALRWWYGIDEKMRQVFKPVTVDEMNDMILDIVDDIFNGDTYKFMRGAVQHNGYLDVNGEKRMLKDYQETLDSDPEAVGILNFMVDLGMKLTGSLAYRKFGSIFRSEDESLHDLDFDVMMSMMKDNPSQLRNVQRLMNKTEEIYRGAERRQRALGKRGKIRLNSKERQAEQRLYMRMDRHIQNTDWFKKAKAKYPSFRLIRTFGNDNYGKFNGITWTGAIEGIFDEKGKHVSGTGYMIDFFIQLTELEDSEYTGMFKTWQNIFKAKIRMGRYKDMLDLITFTPFQSTKYKFTDAGFFLLDFAEKKQNQYTYINGAPVKKFADGPKKC